MTLIAVASFLNTSEAKVLFTEKVGGTNGTNFMLPAERFDILNTEDISWIGIQHGRRVEQIVIEYKNRQNISKAETAGNNAGEWSFIHLEKGEFITYITGRAGTLIDQITFHTSMRRTFGPYGGSGGQDFEITIPPNAKVIGFTGKVGPSIQQIGLIYRTYENGNDEPSGAGYPYDQIGVEQEAPEVFENSPQGPVIQTAPIPPVSKRIRDHRKDKRDSFTIRDSVRVTMYTPATKDFDIQQVIEMNGRGNQEPLAKETTATNKRTVRDHRKVGGNSVFHPDSMRVASFIFPGKEKDNQPFVEMNGRGNQEQEVKSRTTTTTRKIRDHRKKN